MAKALKKAKWLIKNGDEWAICFALERLAQQDEISELTLDHCKQWIQKQLGKGKSIYFYEEWVQTHHYETYKTMAFYDDAKPRHKKSAFAKGRIHWIKNMISILKS